MSGQQSKKGDQPSGSGDQAPRKVAVEVKLDPKDIPRLEMVKILSPATAADMEATLKKVSDAMMNEPHRVTFKPAQRPDRRGFQDICLDGEITGIQNSGGKWPLPE